MKEQKHIDKTKEI